MNTSDELLLSGLGISGYRSFAGEVEYLAPLQKLNFFIGQNNTGKSNILRFIDGHLHHVVSNAINNNRGIDSFEENDLPRHSDASDFKLALAGRHSDYLGPNSGRASFNDDHIRDAFRSLLRELTRPEADDLYWVSYHTSDISSTLQIDSQDVDRLYTTLNISDRDYRTILKRLGRKNIPGQGQKALKAILNEICPTNFQEYSSTAFIPDIREVGTDHPSGGDYSGATVIQRLFRYQSPEHDQWEEDKRKFREITEFVRVVTGADDAQIDIPHTKSTINVHMDGRRLPLENLGTGIHEVVILAAAATILDETLVCIEEPEIHLHPTLQRQLLRYLRDRTNNQYFISTHSAHILDVDGVPQYST